MKRLADYWPLFDLRVITPRLEIRVPRDDELVGLIEEIELGIHHPSTTPFMIPFTDVPSPQLQRDSLQWWWGQRAKWKPENWSMAGAVFVDGRPVGVQDLQATDFAILKTVGSGSWIGQRHQGQGIGKEMRAAILHLAFEGLGAVEAHSGAWEDNARSLAVSRALGYESNGATWESRRGEPSRMIKLRLERPQWERRRRDDIAIEGLEACLEFFGAS